MEPLDSRGIERLRKKCFSFSRTLFAYKRDFNFTLRVGSFEMSLGTNGPCGRKAGPGGRRRNPSYLRRQQRRRQAFLEKRGLARDNLGTGGTGAEAEVRGARDEEVDGREREQKDEVSIEDVCRLVVEWSSEIRGNINDTMKLMDSRTANDPERDEGRGGKLQGSDEDGEDHLLEFASRLEARIKCFQRQVETTDEKVEEARRLTRTTPQSPRRKRRRKR